MTHEHFDPADQGKLVCTADGVSIGRIVAIDSGEAFVSPMEGLLDRYGSLLTPCWRSGQHFRLKQETVQEITDREVTIDIRVDVRTADTTSPL